MRQCLALRNVATASSATSLRWRFAPHRFMASSTSSSSPPPPPNASNSSSSSSPSSAKNSASSSSSTNAASASAEPNIEDLSNVPQEPPHVPPGELNPGGYYQSPAELTHAWDGNPGGFSRGQALYYGYVARQRFHQYLVQEKFQKTWLRRFGRLFVLSLLVSGLINIFLIEGENKDLPYTGHSSLHVRIAAHMMKANPEVMAALGPFIIDFPESLFVSQFRNGHAGFVFAVIGTRARGIVTIELVRNNRFSSVWRVADFSLDLLDGTCVEVMPIGSLFSSVEHKARIKEMFELKRVRQNDGTETTNQLLRQKVETEEEYAQKKRDVQKKASEIERQFNRSQMRELCGLQEDGFNGFMSAADTSQTLLGISNNSKIQK